MDERVIKTPAEKSPVMPDLTSGRYGFHHSADSALATLARLGISPERITINKAGRGWPSLRVTSQYPPAGATLTSNVNVALDIEGDGLFFHLPVGMRDGSKEDEIGTEELTALFDDPVEKAGHFVRQGGFYFNVTPDNQPGCARWIKLFGIDPEQWSSDRWYDLAILLPCLRRLAGLEKGLHLAVQLLLGLKINSIKRLPRYTLLEPESQTKLGENASRLGLDFIVGDGLEDEATLVLELGPMTLEEYNWHQTKTGQRRFDQVLRLVMPYHWVYEVKWLVGAAGYAPELGSENKNSVLGVNSYLGQLGWDNL